MIRWRQADEVEDISRLQVSTLVSRGVPDIMLQRLSQFGRLYIDDVFVPFVPLQNSPAIQDRGRLCRQPSPGSSRVKNRPACAA